MALPRAGRMCYNLRKPSGSVPIIFRFRRSVNVGEGAKLKLTRAEAALIALTAAACVFLLGFYAGRSGTRGVVTVQTGGLRAPASAEVQGSEADALPSGTPDDTDASDAAPDFPLDLNTATAEQLQTLPGIGEVLAQRIVDFREENGPFRLVDEIRDVRGIGEAIFNGIKDYITVG